MPLNLGEQKQPPPWLGWSFTWKAGWERSSSFLLGFCPLMGSLFQNGTHPHTNAKLRLAHSGDLIPEHEHALSSSRFFFFLKGRGNVSSLMKIGSGSAGWPVVRTVPIASLIFCFEGVQGVLVGQKVGNSLWGQRTCSLSCVNRSRSGSDFKACFSSDGGER